jgi:hypothetical protein
MLCRLPITQSLMTKDHAHRWMMQIFLAGHGVHRSDANIQRSSAGQATDPRWGDRRSPLREAANRDLHTTVLAWHGVHRTDLPPMASSSDRHARWITEVLAEEDEVGNVWYTN